MPTISSITLVRSERLRITVEHPEEWSADDVTEALLSVADDLDPRLPLGMGAVKFRVDQVHLGSEVCDDPEWEPLLFTDEDRKSVV